ncbi:MAG: hypothetical protein HOW97_04710, partial [Catenulispora sp.]|nr:hypothetical protein [Catenulispora sp.]
VPPYTKQIQLLLTPNDEEDLLAAVRRRFPEIRVLQGNGWTADGAPPVRAGVAECGQVALLWDPEINPDLPVAVSTTGRVDGPQIGPVVQWIRSRGFETGSLDAGRWAASVDPDKAPRMHTAVSGLWRIAKQVLTNDLILARSHGPDPAQWKAERGFWAGPEAVSLARAGKLTLRSGMLMLMPRP